jgi:hypothetical protein
VRDGHLRYHEVVVKRLLLAIVVLLTTGLAVTVLVAWLIAVTVNVYEGPVESAYTSGEQTWFLKRQENFGSVWLFSARYQGAAQSGFDLAAGIFRIRQEDPTPLLPAGFSPPPPPASYQRGEESAHEFAGQAHGWPMRAMYFSLDEDYTVSASPEVEGGFVTGLPRWKSSVARTAPQPRVLPLRPLWPGFALNTLIFAALFGLVFVPSLLRKRLRRQNACCPHCGYPAGPSPICSECGHPRPSGDVDADATGSLTGN